jgi:hypothetical protein
MILNLLALAALFFPELAAQMTGALFKRMTFTANWEFRIFDSVVADVRNDVECVSLCLVSDVACNVAFYDLQVPTTFSTGIMVLMSLLVNMVEFEFEYSEQTSVAK